jgi:hypothetical protein
VLNSKVVEAKEALEKSRSFNAQSLHLIEGYFTDFPTPLTKEEFFPNQELGTQGEFIASPLEVEGHYNHCRDKRIRKLGRAQIRFGSVLGSQILKAKPKGN